MKLNVIYPKAYADEGQVNLSAIPPEREFEENDDHLAAEIQLDDGSYYVGLNGEHKIGVFPTEPRMTDGHVYVRLDVESNTATVHNYGGTRLDEQDLGPGESVSLDQGHTLGFPHKGETAWSVRRAE